MALLFHCCQPPGESLPSGRFVEVGMIDVPTLFIFLEELIGNIKFLINKILSFGSVLVLFRGIEQWDPIEHTIRDEPYYLQTIFFRATTLGYNHPV